MAIRNLPRDGTIHQLEGRTSEASETLAPGQAGFCRLPFI